MHAILQAHFRRDCVCPHAVPYLSRWVARSSIDAAAPSGSRQRRRCVMGEQRLLDVYEVAFLAGGPDRVVDTALVALVETGRVRVQRAGELSVVDDRPGPPAEAR